MTGGSEKNGSESNGPRLEGAGSTRHALPRDDRETLSALFDGELPGDAARFALRRLDHDLQWRETCGRWLLIGDALRGEATALAPPDFALGVAHALGPLPAHGQATAPASPASRTFPPASRRWMGGVALAASVALAAVLVLRPFQSVPTQGSPALADTPSTAPAAPTAAAPAAAGRAPVEFGRPLPSAGGESLAPVVSPAAPATVAVAEPPRAAPTPGPRRRAAPMAARAQAQAAVATVPAAPAGLNERQPFHPPVEEITTRPWPRPVLSGADSVGAFTVGLDTQSVPAPDPFEPPSSPPADAVGDTPH